MIKTPTPSSLINKIDEAKRIKELRRVADFLESLTGEHFEPNSDGSVDIDNVHIYYGWDGDDYGYGRW